MFLQILLNCTVLLIAARQFLNRHWKSLPFATLGVFVLGLYLAFLLPGLHHFGDVTKAQFIGRLLGVTHPTGYPLYALVTYPLSWIPFGSLALRMNALSALCASAAVVLLARLMTRMGVRPSLACVLGALFAVSRVFFSQAVIAEMYSLNMLFVAGTFLVLTRFAEKGKKSDLVLGCGIYALSFAHHLTVVTLLPAVAVLVLASRPKAVLDWRVLLGIFGSILFGAGLYGYLFWRTKVHSLYLEYSIPDWTAFEAYIRGERYEEKMLELTRELFRARTPDFARQIERDLGSWIWVVPLGGFVLPFLSKVPDGSTAKLGLRERSLVPSRFLVPFSLLLGALGEFVFVVRYDIPDIEIYLIPVEAFLVVLAGGLLEALLRFCGERLGRARWFEVVFVVVLGAMAARGAVQNAPNHDKSVRFERKVRKLLEDVGEDVVIAGNVPYGERMGLVYFLYAEGASERRRIHLVKAPPRAIQRFLEGGELRDRHTNAVIPKGSRVLVHRSNRAAFRGERDLALRRDPSEYLEVVRAPSGAPAEVIEAEEGSAEAEAERPN